MDGWAAKPTLLGELVLLRPFTESDAEAMERVLDDPEVQRLTGSVVTSAEAAQPFVADDRFREWYATRNAQDDRLDLAVVDRETGHVVGEVVLNERDEATASCNLRVLIGKDGRDRGLGSEAVRPITAYGLDVLGLHRISLEIYDFNPRARRVYEKVGYVHEGTKRDALRFDGEWVDAHVMAILSTDPRPGRAT